MSRLSIFLETKDKTYKKLTEKEEQNFFLLIKTQLTNSQLNASRVLKTQFKSTHNSSFAFENLKSNCQINES